MLGQRLAGQRYHIALPLTHLLYSLCPTTIVVLAQYLSDQVHKEVHVSSHIDVQVQTCNDAPGSELRRQRQRDGGSMFQFKYSTFKKNSNIRTGNYNLQPTVLNISFFFKKKERTILIITIEIYKFAVPISV